MWCSIVSCCIAIHFSTIGPSSLPTPREAMAIGYDDTTNLVWLIGGVSSRDLTSPISFNLSIWNEPNAFINSSVGNNTLHYQVLSYGQAYTQTEDVIYVVTDSISSNSKLLAFDISTVYITETNTNPSRYSLTPLGCLASLEGWIIYTDLNALYILSTSNLLWTFTGTPLMSTTRGLHSCTIEPDEGYLYVIGGVANVSDEVGLKSIEKVYVNDIENINQYNFTTLTDSLTSAKSYTRAIIHKTNIFVVGGLEELGSESDTIDIIDTRNDSVVLWGRLHEGIYRTSPIIVADIMYIFGGLANGKSVDYWQYFNMFSNFICVCRYNMLCM